MIGVSRCSTSIIAYRSTSAVNFATSIVSSSGNNRRRNEVSQIENAVFKLCFFGIANGYTSSFTATVSVLPEPSATRMEPV